MTRPADPVLAGSVQAAHPDVRVGCSRVGDDLTVIGGAGVRAETECQIRGAVLVDSGVLVAVFGGPIDALQANCRFSYAVRRSGSTRWSIDDILESIVALQQRRQRFRRYRQRIGQHAAAVGEVQNITVLRSVVG